VHMPCHLAQFSRIKPPHSNPSIAFDWLPI
jgi:hypothetical protein